jgi:hypothetical protein
MDGEMKKRYPSGLFTKRKRGVASMDDWGY